MGTPMLPMPPDELLQQNALLVAQVKRLVRLEQRLHASERRSEAQNRRIVALNEFALSAPHCRSEVEILHKLVDVIFSLLSAQAAFLVYPAPIAGPTSVSLRTPGETLREVTISPTCQEAVQRAVGLDQALVLAAIDPGTTLAPLFLECLEELAPPSEWERSALQRAYLVMPLGDEPSSGGWRALLVARCSVPTQHGDLIAPADRSFLQLLCRHTGSAMEVVGLRGELEARVERRTRELAAANERQRESLASLDEAQRELLQQMSELIRTREQLVQAEKAAMAGRLAAMVAHEVNGPLGFMQSNLRLLGEHAAHDEELPELVAETQEGARRIAELVRGLSVLGGLQQRAAPEAVDVAEALELTLSSLPEPQRSAVRIDRPPPAGTAAWVSRDDLRMALASLLRFLCGPVLRRAAPGRVVTIRSDAYARHSCVVFTAREVHLSDEERRKLLEPRVESFEASHGLRAQFSVDLALAYEVLRRNGAELSAVDEPDGITFRVLVPRPRHGLAPEGEGEQHPGASARGGRLRP